ncbi:prepilin peptidase [Candidatus Berkelbacteria bacterium CG10_big_fil_rev_8_21_14_0_10_43_13]|uniref:Prepilin peptidase n=1 Tax=Candidatus Berkelbacteria bacterium CG10_big_fil_rev_8_21_14_0_10_43_13 TaxID=1974514 RepID=A0A2H0W744_9BACT|nr:MAG: prepilin peptidase [Candidatus Berkelbacteria bacterium CG10_big_fil_rev_8_21_14_0_10_43_13]
MTTWLIPIFILGLIAGSFLNVVIFRMDDLKSILTTRSRCQSCQKTIAWYDLIPFLSFFLLRARCRNCGEKISVQYPLVEIFTGVLFAYLYLMYGMSWGLVFYLIIFSVLLVVFVYDLKTQTVPEIFVWAVVVLSLLGGAYFGGFTLLSQIFGGIIGGGFLFLLVYFSKEKWMGWGDVKIGLILGLLTGYPNAIFALFFAFVFGSIVGLVMIYFQKKTLKTAIPFAPFIIFSTLFSLTYGQIFINWYLNLFMLR